MPKGAHCKGSGCDGGGCTGGCTSGCRGGCCSLVSANGYSASDWDWFNSTMAGAKLYRWWADWMPTSEGRRWCHDKLWEARRVVDGMIHCWGLEALQSGEGVIDIGGDPGFLAAELLRSNIPVVVVDPAFGVSGKQNSMTTRILRTFDSGKLRLIRQRFDQAFVDDPKNGEILCRASAVVSLYPDEATNQILYYTAAFALRTALMPCNECQQFFPPGNPTFEGFVEELLSLDMGYSQKFGTAPMKREGLCDMPYCKVILHRSPTGPPRARAQLPRSGRRLAARRRACGGGLKNKGFDERQRVRAETREGVVAA